MWKWRAEPSTFLTLIAACWIGRTLSYPFPRSRLIWKLIEFLIFPVLLLPMAKDSTGKAAKRYSLETNSSLCSIWHTPKIAFKRVEWSEQEMAGPHRVLGFFSGTSLKLTPESTGQEPHPQTPQQPFCIKLLFCGFCCSKVQRKPGRVAGVTAASGVEAEESFDFSSEPDQKK